MRVGFVGLGNMGGRMTRRMVQAGHDVLAVDADASRIPACGATPAASLADLAARCDVIMLSLPDSAVIETVIRGPGGLLGHARSNGPGHAAQGPRRRARRPRRDLDQPTSATCVPSPLPTPQASSRGSNLNHDDVTL
jgi:hypothetical protein